MTRTARAVIVDGPGRHRLVRGPLAHPGPGEARVAVYAAAVSPRDRSLYEGTHPHRYPVVPGHEWSGTVDGVGEGVDPALVGRRVVGEPLRGCGACDRCREGAAELCAVHRERAAIPPGAFADAVTVPATSLHALPDDGDLSAAALAAPTAEAVAAVEAGAPGYGERVAVIGAGTVGLLTVQLLASRGVRQLLVVEPRVPRADAAFGMGATDSADLDELYPGGDLDGCWDLVIDTLGGPRTGADGCVALRPGGRLVLAAPTEPGALGLDPALLTTRQVTVRALGPAPSRAWTVAVRALRDGVVDPSGLVSHRLGLEEFATAMELVTGDDPRVGRVLLHP
ncbi:alcohol dehydrogenase catalytic domain-containing protein [Streptomyces sp. NPDC005438]|uniref:zinc-dependent alcohol dehydrogenase n=1 Tax=Streptomyces sp. NPDC005438 TaxID=3156880 RepID=UPI0033B0FE18